MSLAVAEADRRIANLIQIGIVTSVDGAGGTARVQIGDLASTDLPVCPLRAGAATVWWMPSSGEQVVVLAPSGDMARGLILASIFASNAPSADPAVPMIDLRGGDMVIKGGTLRIEADLEITGKIDITGDVTCDADVIASGISLTTHVHTGVRSGPDNTGGPA